MCPPQYKYCIRSRTRTYLEPDRKTPLMPSSVLALPIHRRYRLSRFISANCPGAAITANELLTILFCEVRTGSWFRSWLDGRGWGVASHSQIPSECLQWRFLCVICGVVSIVSKGGFERIVLAVAVGNRKYDESSCHLKEWFRLRIVWGRFWASWGLIMAYFFDSNLSTHYKDHASTQFCLKEQATWL